MLALIKKIFTDVFTEPGATNNQVCPCRVIAVLGAFTFLGLAIVHYHQHHIFDAQQFALGFSTMIAGTGVALGMKKDSPPPAPPAGQ